MSLLTTYPVLQEGCDLREAFESFPFAYVCMLSDEAGLHVRELGEQRATNLMYPRFMAV
jgi:hypothetical protein